MQMSHCILCSVLSVTCLYQAYTSAGRGELSCSDQFTTGHSKVGVAVGSTIAVLLLILILLVLVYREPIKKRITAIQAGRKK